MKLALSTLLLFFIHKATFAYQINVSELVAYQLGQQQIAQLMQKIYAPLDITPTLVVLPSERGLEYVDQGFYDAEAFALALLQMPILTYCKYPNHLQPCEWRCFVSRRNVVLCRPDKTMW
ncbi:MULTISPECIES: hypothetical protein [unclassified Pseudoalteromonas]|uniref:hypothetical protein n=1 Tax=unclassified Pseudoalteromonas TaxID=194690 RepID=UPI001F1E3B5A|nr:MULTISPECIES: hypothetical protein [unclassified Pseudoalteromonas]MCF2829515.1 hypothetical protein [Pseudoalteromonas sp. OF5H-5]MCF2831621.1 hypothetical protein [Pseudoalteromonas sp. DL2-H6]MCF2927568.1 hypothetical protein [Pseudoalteromonas sp. DL2-H1]